MKGKPKFALPSFCNTTIDSKCLPVSYAHDKYNEKLQPDQHTVCDFSTCTNESVSNAVRLGCFHTCHATCLEENQNQCQLCKLPLAMKVEELAESFNSSLLHHDSEILPTSNDTSNDEDEIEPPVTISTSKDYNFYQSNEWKEFVEMELADVNVSQPPIPHKPTQKPAQVISTKKRRCTICKECGHNKNNCRLLKLNNSLRGKDNSTSGTTVSAAPLSGIQVKATAMDDFTIWSFPFGVSQSTINGRMGSNACTLIALLLAKTYLMNKNLLQLYPAQPLSGHWNTVMVSCILGGNNVYDSCIPHGRFLGILEAIPFVACSIGEIDLNEELTVCFTKEDDADNSSALSHHLTSYFDTSNNSAAFVIINGKTITFLKQENAIIVLDTHADFERNSGATVSIAPMHKIGHLLAWIKARISQTINLCTVTFVKYLP